MILKFRNLSFNTYFSIPKLLCKKEFNFLPNTLRCYSSKTVDCEILIVGGGTAGCCLASKFVKTFKNKKIVVVDPATIHYYQPMFTLIGAGLKTKKQSFKLMNDVLPKNSIWINDAVVNFDPDDDLVYTKKNCCIKYDFLIVACGLVLHFEDIKGLTEALCDENSGVSSNYKVEFAEKTFRTLQKLKEGDAVFTFPNTPVKCAGAPIKVCLMSEDYTVKKKLRENINFHYYTPLQTIFSCEHYEKALINILNKRCVKINRGKELVSVNHNEHLATFRHVSSNCGTTSEEMIDECINYSMLHVTPPMKPPPELRKVKSLVDKNGYLKVHKNTLQHVEYPNIFGIGDCTNLPTSKTGAAVIAQKNVVFENIINVMCGKPVKPLYDGYTSCPLITAYGKGILAEFDYNLEPLETFPFSQSKERRVLYHLKKDILPCLYWCSLKSYFNGPAPFRKILNFRNWFKKKA